ncbi:hypothetical protein Trydic_g15272 [Trypoxylus dichotomus]
MTLTRSLIIPPTSRKPQRDMIGMLGGPQNKTASRLGIRSQSTCRRGNRKLRKAKWGCCGVVPLLRDGVPVKKYMLSLEVVGTITWKYVYGVTQSVSEH